MESKNLFVFCVKFSSIFMVRNLLRLKSVSNSTNDIDIGHLNKEHMRVGTHVLILGLD